MLEWDAFGMEIINAFGLPMSHVSRVETQKNDVQLKGAVD